MKKKIAILVAALGIAGAVAFYFISGPNPLDETAISTQIASHKVDLKNGQILYNAGGCISCHRPAKGVKAQNLPSGGAVLKTPVGLFFPPNITPDEKTGIGRWSSLQFLNAMKRGLSPEGKHYFPAFPYTSYTHMSVGDLLDLQAYLNTLKPVDASENKKTSLFGEDLLRRGVGGWKWLGLQTNEFEPQPSQSAGWNRGAYLVTGPGHCSECHTPRNFLMVSDYSRILQGGPHPEGKGKVPSLVGLVKRKKFKDIEDLNSALRFGEIMGYEDISSGGMGEVQTNMSKLPDSDTRAIAEYILSFK